MLLKKLRYIGNTSLVLEKISDLIDHTSHWVIYLLGHFYIKNTKLICYLYPELAQLHIIWFSKIYNSLPFSKRIYPFYDLFSFLPIFNLHSKRYCHLFFWSAIYKSFHFFFTICIDNDIFPPLCYFFYYRKPKR